MKQAALLTVVASLGWLASCGGEPPARDQQNLPPVAVRTVAVEQAEWPAVYEAVGTVTARNAATLSAKLMSHITEVRADAGDRVRAGQVLVLLDARDLDAGLRRAQAARAEANSAMTEVENAIAAAKARMDLADSTLRRMKDLHDQKSITEQEFDEASAKDRMARANYQMAVSKKSQLADKIQQAEEAVASATIMKGYAVLKAPFDGIVTNKMVDPGDLAAPGAPLMTIERASGYRLEARVEASRLASVKAGQKVEVELDALDRTLTAHVSEIIPAIDAASRAFTVRINLPRLSGLHSGLFGRARFRMAPKQAIVIPPESVVTRGQVQSVFVVENGHSRGRLVTLGESRDGAVEVLSGLAAGEKVVSPIPPTLLDGSPVEVRP